MFNVNLSALIGLFNWAMQNIKLAGNKETKCLNRVSFSSAKDATQYN